MSTELVAIERINIKKDNDDADALRSCLAHYLQQFLDSASIESMTLHELTIKIDGESVLDVSDKTGGVGLSGLDKDLMKKLLHRQQNQSQKHLYGGLLLLLVMVQVMERFHVRKSVCTLHSFGVTTKGYLIVEKESVSIQAHTKLATVDVICFALTTTALFLFCNM